MQPELYFSKKGIGPIQSFYMAAQIDNKLTNQKDNDDKVATLINMTIDTISEALSAK